MPSPLDTHHLSKQILPTGTGLDENNESAWIEVIHKMDEVYADLLRYQVELEEKNSALEEAQGFIRGVLSSMSDTLIVCDLHGVIKQCNRALAELTGMNEQALVGKKLFSIFTASSAEALNYCQEHIWDGASDEHDVMIEHRNGSKSPLVIRCSPQYDHDGALVGMVLIGRPIGELRQAYNELHRTHVELKQAQMHLVQSEKMASLGRLVAGVAHELNNPISFVHSNMFTINKYGLRLRQYIEALHEKLGNDAVSPLREELKIDRVLDDIPSLVEAGLEGTQRVSKIVQDLKRFSTAHRESAHRFNLTAVVETAVNWVVSTASCQHICVDMQGDNIEVSNFEGYIHQVVVNLVQNGLDAMDDVEQPQLNIRCWLDEDLACVQIRDHGTGIPEKDLMSIFDPFFTTKEIGKGTGLGLYVSYGLIVEQCGGEMSAHNHPDGGAVFTFSIPVTGPQSNE